LEPITLPSRIYWKEINPLPPRFAVFAVNTCPTWAVPVIVTVPVRAGAEFPEGSLQAKISPKIATRAINSKSLDKFLIKSPYFNSYPDAFAGLPSNQLNFES
jgi:hypothetical protein